ncbi:MAG: hypothetical protein ACYCST_18650 [Acidimicrobiales bacterium]
MDEAAAPKMEQLDEFIIRPLNDLLGWPLWVPRVPSFQLRGEAGTHGSDRQGRRFVVYQRDRDR